MNGGMSGGGSGHWVRTRNPEGAKAFMAEQRMEGERRKAAAARSRERRKAAIGWVKARWRQLFRR